MSVSQDGSSSGRDSASLVKGLFARRGSLNVTKMKSALQEESPEEDAQLAREHPPIVEVDEETKAQTAKFDEKLAKVIERMTLEGRSEEDILAYMTKEWQAEERRRLSASPPPPQPQSPVVARPAEPVPEFINRFLDALNKRLGFDQQRVNETARLPPGYTHSRWPIQQQMNMTYEALVLLQNIPRGVKDIDAFPTHPYEANEGGDFQTQCSICMCDYEDGEELRSLPCLHSFHSACVDPWLRVSVLCPECKYEMSV